MRYRRIPDQTVNRLAVYLRDLMLLSNEGVEHISSRKLAESLGVEAWQIRKDFSYFGELGTRGVGYDVKKLIRQVRRILRLDVIHKAALVGVGNLGRAVLAYPGFRAYGFHIAAAFDSDPEKVGQKVNEIEIEDVRNLDTMAERGIRMGIMAVPRHEAQKTADRLVEAGVKGILNFCPCYITIGRGVKVITVDIAMYLARLPYYMPGEGRK